MLIKATSEHRTVKTENARLESIIIFHEFYIQTLFLQINSMVFDQFHHENNSIDIAQNTNISPNFMETHSS